MKLLHVSVVLVVLLGLLCEEGCHGIIKNTVKGVIWDLMDKPFYLIGAYFFKKALLTNNPILKLIYYKKYNLMKPILLFNKLSRGKRSAEQVAHEAAMLESSHEEFEKMLTMAQAMDAAKCLPRAICEVTARGHQQPNLNEFEKTILTYYGEDPRPETLVNQTAASFDFSYAAFLGQHSKEPKACNRAYPQCLESSDRLRNMLQIAFDNDLCS